MIPKQMNKWKVLSGQFISLQIAVNSEKKNWSKLISRALAKNFSGGGGGRNSQKKILGRDNT